ncbi:MAG: fatty acid desaturase family protein [Chitinophagaceae bacterium]
MTNNLENIPFDAVFSRSGESYIQFRKSLTPRYAQAWFQIFLTVTLLTIPFIAYLFLPTTWRWILLPVCVFYIGYLIAFLHLFIHEAAHFNLHPDKKTNDRLAGYILCLFFGITLKEYRKIHWTHHLHLATPEDAEISYFTPVNFKFFVRILTGSQVLSVIRTRNKSKASENYPTASTGRLLLTVGLHLLLIIAAWYCGSYPLVIGWIVAVTIVFPLLATLRQILEHRADDAGKDPHYYLNQPRQRSSRLFESNLFSTTFGGAGFNRHMIHHWDPQISYTRINDVISFLEQSPVTASIIRQSKTSYSKVFLRLSGLK